MYEFTIERFLTYYNSKTIIRDKILSDSLIEMNIVNDRLLDISDLLEDTIYRNFDITNRFNTDIVHKATFRSGGILTLTIKDPKIIMKLKLTKYRSTTIR